MNKNNYNEIKEIDVSKISLGECIWDRKYQFGRIPIKYNNENHFLIKTPITKSTFDLQYYQVHEYANPKIACYLNEKDEFLEILKNIDNMLKEILTNSKNIITNTNEEKINNIVDLKFESLIDKEYVHGDNSKSYRFRYDIYLNQNSEGKKYHNDISTYLFLKEGEISNYVLPKTLQNYAYFLNSNANTEAFIELKSLLIIGDNYNRNRFHVKPKIVVHQINVTKKCQCIQFLNDGANTV